MLELEPVEDLAGVELPLLAGEVGVGDTLADEPTELEPVVSVELAPAAVEEGAVKVTPTAAQSC